jgi:hypothetical protein
MKIVAEHLKKMKEKTRFYVFHGITWILLVLLTILFFEYIDLPGDTYGESDDFGFEVDWGFMSTFLFWVFVATFLGYGFWILLYHSITEHKWPKRDEDWYQNHTPGGGKFILLIVLFIVLSIITLLAPIATRTSGLYNTLIQKEAQYEKLMEQRKGFFNKMYNLYITKKEISLLNRDTFIEVTRILMEGQKDAPTLAWKWASERQRLDYGEFTKFYSDLSSFIQSERENYYALETTCQNAAAEYNILLRTFPNNIINSTILHKQELKFEYGFLNDATTKSFETKKEVKLP